MILQGECLSSLELKMYVNTEDVVVTTVKKESQQENAKEVKKQRHESQRNDTESNNTNLTENERAPRKHYIFDALFFSPSFD